MDISASLNAALPGLANATVVGLNDPIANSAPAPATAAAPAPTAPAATSQAVAGVLAGGATATPTGAGQAAAGALPVQGGGGAIDPKLIAALEELIKVLAALVEQLKAGATGGGPTAPGKGGGPVQQSPIQSPIQAPVTSPTGGGGAPTAPAPAPGAQPAPPTVGGGAPAVHTGH
jgi:hypothetical protein